MKTYERSSQALFADVGDDVVALHVANGNCYGMEAAAAAVWGLLEQPTNLERLCDTLVQRYAVSPDTCRVEVERLLDQLEREGLVEAH